MAGGKGQFRLDCATDGQGGRSWFWRLTNDFGVTIATSERFPDQDAAKKAAKWVRTKAAQCVLDPPVLATDQQSLGVALSPDGTLVAIWNDGVPTSTIRVLDTATLRLFFTLPATTISGVTFSDDDRLLVVADQSGGLHITTLSSGHTMVGHGWTQNCSTGAGYSPAVSSDDRFVAVYSFCGQVSVGRVRTARPFESFDQRGQLSQIAFDPAGDRLALGSWDSTVTVLNVATDKPARTGREHPRRQWCDVQPRWSIYRYNQRR